LLAFLLHPHLILRGIQLFLEPRVRHLAPARVQLVLLLAMPLVHEIVDASLANLTVACVLLPRLNHDAQVEVVPSLRVKFVKQALLCLGLLFQIADVVLLVGNRLHHLRNLVVPSTGVLVEVLLKLRHVALAHISVRLYKPLLELCLNSVDCYREIHNGASCVLQSDCWAHFGNLGDLSHG